MPRFLSARWQSGLAFMASLALSASVTAQEKLDGPKERAAESWTKAGQYLHNRQLPEAEKAYLEAVKHLEQQMTLKNSDEIVHSWCQCRLSPKRMLDLYSVELEANAPYKLEMRKGEGEGNKLDCFVALLDSRWRLHRWLDDGVETLDAVVELSVPTKGTYYIVATSYLGSRLMETSWNEQQPEKRSIGEMKQTWEKLLAQSKGNYTLQISKVVKSEEKRK